MSDLGAVVVPGLYEAELRYLQREEWAVTGDDVLWRRSKLGLHLTADERAQVADWMKRHPADGVQTGGLTRAVAPSASP